jgi:glycosyltransferase involved in cell wall biosynthesis
MQKSRILFIYSNFSSFVEKDYKMLSSVYEVDQYRFRAIKGLVGTGIELIRQFIFLILNIWKYDAVFVWFADYHSLLPVLFARMLLKKSFVVVGGYDVSYLPEYNYGSFNKPIRKFFAKTTLRLATICFPVAEALKEKIRKISPHSTVEVLPTSTDSKQFDFSDSNRQKIVITVASADSYQRAMIKGLDRFRELAITMPDFEFIIIGINKTFESYFTPVPGNLKFESSIPYSELPAHYNKASFYAQFSRSEGLPNSLCEAMLCGCIPIGTNVGDIKPAIEGIGLVLSEWDPEIIPGFIRNNHNNKALREYSRSRIMEKYDPEIRRKRLTNLI